MGRPFQINKFSDKQQRLRTESIVHLQTKLHILHKTGQYGLTSSVHSELALLSASTSPERLNS